MEQLELLRVFPKRSYCGVPDGHKTERAPVTHPLDHGGVSLLTVMILETRNGSGKVSNMPSHTATRWLIGGLFVLTLGQALWIFSAGSTPALTKIVSATPISKHSAVYEVLSDAGGATVPMTYLYFVAEKKQPDDQALQSLRTLTPFLVTRQSGAVKYVEGLRISARTEEQVYSYSSSTALRENGAVLPVTVELTATARQK